MNQAIMQAKRVLFTLGGGIGVLFWIGIALLIALVSGRHFSPWEAPSVFLQHRQEHYWLFLPALYIHIITAPLALIFGALSNWSALRNRVPKLHASLGKGYVLLVLLGAAPSGWVMAFWALGGWLGQLCFLLLSCWWGVFTWKGWQMALQQNWQRHQLFMWRSFALCTSAFWLRFFSFLGVYFWGWKGAEAYLVAAWLSWLFPLGVVEIILYFNSLTSK